MKNRAARDSWSDGTTLNIELTADNPEIFLRINSRLHLERSVKDPQNYENIILHNVYNRHKLSVAMLTYLFKNEVRNEQIWEYIEELLLRQDTGGCFGEYEGGISPMNCEFIPLMGSDSALSALFLAGYNLYITHTVWACVVSNIYNLFAVSPK